VNALGNSNDNLTVFLLIFFLLFIGVLALSSNHSNTGQSSNQSTSIATTAQTTNAKLLIFNSSDHLHPLSSLDWGWLGLGANITRYAYLQNAGTVNFTVTFSQVNFNPPYASTIKMTSNLSTTKILMPKQNVTVAWTLHIPLEMNVTDFGFTILVTMFG